MKRRLFFITLLMLFCTTMFGQQHWTMSNSDIVDYPLNTIVTCSVTIEGQVPQNITDLEIGAFHNNVLRGVAKPVSNGFGGYIVYLTVRSGSEGEIISFKLYNPATDKEYDTDYTIRFSNDIVGDFINPVQIDFYSMHWSYNNNAENYMAYPCVIKIDGVIQNNPNLEIAAFINDELCGVAKPALEPNINIYMATLQIYGTNGQTINFKLFDPSIGENGAELETVYTETYNYDYNGGIVEIDFRNEAVAQIGDTYYKTLADAFAAVQNNQTITLITDVELSNAISFTKDITFTIDGNGKTIKPAEDSTEANSAFNLGQGNDGTVATRIYTIKNIVFDGWTTDHVVRLQGVNATVEGCTFQNCNQADGLGLLTLTFCEAKVKDCDFLNNTCVKAIDINSWGDNSEKNATIEECVFDNNECNTTAVVYRNDGEKLVVKDSKFLNNKVNATGNAATLYAGWATNDVITGCYFANNTVTTSHATTIRFASAIFCDGCTVTGNAFENNTATRNGETITTTVAVGAYYGAANVSENYWGGDAPEAGVDYTVEFTSKDVVVKTYYKEYDATAGTLSELTRLPWAEFKQGYAGYVGDTETRENISVDLWDVYADNSVVVKIYSADNTLLSTTTLRTNNREDNAPIARPVVKETFTANVVVWGKLSGSWDTEWHVAPSVEYIPNKFEVWCDGVLCDTFVGFNYVDAYMALDGVLKVAKVTNGETITYYASLEKALKALTENATLTLLDNVTIAENWDCRSNGAKITVPVTIDGNGKTLKLTGIVNDSNWNTVFRIENAATVKNLTIDVTEATGVQRCITTNSSIVADNCTFLGTTNTRYGIIVGEGAGNNIGNVTANINKCNFTNIQAGVSDNANGQDAKSFTITESNFNNADVVISAAENVTFNKNVMSNNSYVDIRSYAHVGQLEVEANDNTLQANTADNYNQIIAKLENIDAQEGFLTPVAEIDGKYYVTLQDAFDKGGNVKVLTDITLAEGVTVAEGKTVVLDLNGKKISRDTEAAISSAAITNNGNLTIKDSSEPSTGKVTAFAANPDTQAIPYYASNTITNCGVLTVLSGTIENSTGDEARAAYPIDNNSTLRDVALYIEGGTITGRGAIRLYANSNTNKNEVNVTAGTVTGTSYAIWVQNPGSGDPKASLNIEGGVLSKILMDPNANFEASIDGGTISEVAIWEPDATNPGRNPSGFITGGTFGMDVTEFCAFNYVCTSNGDGTYGIEYKQQEDNAFVIETLHELEAFRDAVNAGNTFSGQTVVLSAGVDLNPTRAINYWEPIGTQANPFEGTFDGDNNTISHLVVEGENYLGLFGKTSGATIKNVKINNVTINGVSYLGAIVGMGYTGTIDNCHVTGDVKIAGNYMVGGINGQGYATVNNSSVVANDNSFVKAIHDGNNNDGNNNEGDNVGGIVGHCGETNTLTANTVKNITISGTRKVGGIVGIANQGTKVENCVVEDVTIETSATEAYANDNITTMSIGALIGQYQNSGSAGTVKDCMVKNVEFKNVNNVNVSVGPITGGSRGGTDGMLAPTGVTASNNNIYMSTITGSNNLYLMDPVAKIGETEYYTLQEAVAASETNETTIDVIANTAETINVQEGANITINNINLTGSILAPNATLKIVNGSIVNNNSNVSAIEINDGTLNLEGVNITSARHAVRIDGAVIATIDGGTYKSAIGEGTGTYHALNIGNKTSQVAANVTITAGTFVGPKGTTADSGSAVNVQTGSTVTIEDGDFSGGKNATLGVSGEMIVKGGRFDQDPSAYLADAYTVNIENEMYVVRYTPIMVTYPVGNPVYPEGKVEYYSDMLEAVPYTTNCPRLEGAIITLLADVSGAGMRFMENDMVFDLNGHTYTITAGTGSQGTNTSGFQIRPEVTTNVLFKNGTIKVAEGAPVVWMFNCYATDFIVEDVTVDCSNMAYSYGGSCYVVVSREGDNVQLTGETKIVNFNSDVAGNAINVGDTMTIGEEVALGENAVIELDGGAQLTAPAGLNVVAVDDDDDDYMVVYENGVYKSVKVVAQVGVNKFGSVIAALNDAITNNAAQVEIVSDSRELMPTDVYLILNADLEITAAQPYTVKFYNNGTSYDFVLGSNNNNTFTIGENVTFQLEDRVIWMGYYGNNVDVVVKGTLAAYQIWHGADTQVTSTGTIKTTGEAFVMRRGATLTVNGGKVNANYFNILAGNILAEDAEITCGAMWIANTGNYIYEGNVNINIKSSTLTSNGNLTSSTAHADGVSINFENSEVTFVLFDGYGVSSIDANTVLNIKGENAEVSIVGLTNNGLVNVTEKAKPTLTGTVTNNGAMKLDATSVIYAPENLGVTIDDNDYDVVYENGAYRAVHKPFVAEVDGTQFTSLQAAIDAADGKTVVVLDNITLTETVTVAAGTTVTLDLNGKTVSQTKEQTTGYQMILNDGNLTIVDNTNEKLGKISYTDSGNGGEYVSNTITNRGTITVKSGTIENLSSQTVAQNGYPYAIDSSIWGDASEVNTIVEGGKVHGATYSAIRLRADSNSEPVNVTVSGGEIVGTIEVQVPSSTVAGKGALVISGGKLSNSGTSNVLFFFGSGASAENIEVSVTGGEFTGNITISSSYPIGDNFNKNFITGGTFATDVNDYCHEYYAAIQGDDNLWRVEQVLFAQTTELQAGWNWFSSYVDLSTPDGLEKIQTALGTNGIQIKGNYNNNSSTYENLGNGSYAWIGDFTPSAKQMYMINTSSAVTINVAGEMVDYKETPINLRSGWNWIGYPVSEAVDVNTALADLNGKVSGGDVIKTFGKSSQYSATSGKWVGQLKELKPGEGYMYKSSTSTSFVYSVGTGSKVENVDRTIEEKYWMSDVSEYANNMTVVAMLSIDGEIVKDNYEIAAFVNGECRGSERPIYVEELDAYVLFLTIHGDDVEELTFKYYDVNYGTEYELSNRINYSNDAVVGSVDEPYMFNLDILNIGETSVENISIYPNPTTTGSEINLQAVCDKVEVFNALGVKVAEYTNVDSIDAIETAGVYVIRLTIDNSARNCRLIVK